MGRMPEALATFGPALLGCLAFGIITHFNSLHAELAQIRIEIVHLQEQRAEFATNADVEAELGTTAQRKPGVRIVAVEVPFSGDAIHTIEEVLRSDAVVGYEVASGSHKAMFDPTGRIVSEKRQ